MNLENLLKRGIRIRIEYDPADSEYINMIFIKDDKFYKRVIQNPNDIHLSEGVCMVAYYKLIGKYFSEDI